MVKSSEKVSLAFKSLPISGICLDETKDHLSLDLGVDLEVVDLVVDTTDDIATGFTG